MKPIIRTWRALNELRLTFVDEYTYREVVYSLNAVLMLPRPYDTIQNERYDHNNWKDQPVELPSHTDGGYPVYYITSGGDAICPQCVNKNNNHSFVCDDFDPVVDYEVNLEEVIYCDECSQQIESLYEPEQPDDDEDYQEEE